MSIPIALTCLCLGWSDPAGPGTPAPASASAFEVVASIETVVADAIARAEPSVVAIARQKDEDNPTNQTRAVRGMARPATGRASSRRMIDPARDYLASDYGAGIVIGDRGEILTAFHVVRGASGLAVRAAGRQQFDAEVIAADPRSDLAVIVPIPQPGVEPPRLKPAAIGDAGRLRKGSFLVALGNPFNAARDGRPSAAWGILANIARRVEPEGDAWSGQKTNNNLHNYPTLLQLDSKLNLGMSGGAVVNMRGELVGLTTTADSTAGFDAQAGYAIPMDRISRRAIALLKQGREVEYGLLGIVSMDGSNRVSEVRPNSPAADGQILAHDEIVAVEDEPVSSFDTLILAINALSPADPVRLRILRNGKSLERTVVLAKFPVEGEIIATNRPEPWRGIRVDYSSSLNYRSPDPTPFNVASRGVIVTEVEEGSAAASAGLKKGQLIAKVDDQPVATPSQFEAAVAKKAQSVKLLTDQGPVTVKP